MHGIIPWNQRENHHKQPPKLIPVSALLPSRSHARELRPPSSDGMNFASGRGDKELFSGATKEDPRFLEHSLTQCVQWVGVIHLLVSKTTLSVSHLGGCHFS